MKLLISDESMELISHPLTMVFSVVHFLKVGSIGSGYAISPLICPSLSLPEMYISIT